MMRFRTIVVMTVLTPAFSSFGNTALAEDRTDKSIAHAVDYLMSIQRASGAISDSGKNKTAMTSLAILSMTAIGHHR